VTVQGGTIVLGGAPQGLIALDLNGDGLVDLATAEQKSNLLVVALGLGNRRFAAPQGWPSGRGLAGLVGADLDGDMRATTR
jgi:hypothetical protein